MKLQLALDLCTTDEALALLEQTHDLIDIAEVGTPMIMAEGMSPVRAIKDAYPSLTVLADLKIADAGEHEAKIGFDAGADIVTVLGVVDNATIEGAVRSGGIVMADTISVVDVAARARELVDLGVDLICVHTAYDRQASGADPLAELAEVVEAIGPDQSAVAGGINADKAARLLRYRPAVVVVGGSITGAPNVRTAAEEIRGILDS